MMQCIYVCTYYPYSNYSATYIRLDSFNQWRTAYGVRARDEGRNRRRRAMQPCYDSASKRHDFETVNDLADNWLCCLYAIMDSLANYASDGDNSNNSDDVKVSNREDICRMVGD